MTNLTKSNQLKELEYRHSEVFDAYWFLIDSRHYDGRKDPRAISHWKTVLKLEKKIEELQAELS